LLAVNAAMNENLRTRIFTLQKKYIKIPKLLEADANGSIFDWIGKTFPLAKQETIAGADHYRHFFNRTQRRDIAKGHFILDQEKGQVVVSRAVLNKDGHPSDVISRIHLNSETPQQDMDKIKAHIDAATHTTDSEGALKQRVVALKRLLADEALEAETSRNEILYKIEEIQQQKAALVEYRQKKEKTIGIIALLAILVNLVMLYLMALLVVERPLKRLTQALEKINQGKQIVVPFQKQTDRIGILARAIKDFQAALSTLHREEHRKKMERTLIEDLVCKLSGLIDGLQKKALAMKDTANELNLLATDMEKQTLGATQSASKTVNQTDKVSDSTQTLESAVADISDQVARQNELIGDIHTVTQTSRQDIGELTVASDQINDIVQMVKKIAGDTKRLSLNARIEAARSGAAGKGFTVVAEEVRTLSIKTEAANQDIADKIAAIQRISRTIIENTGRIETRIGNLMGASHLISGAVEAQTRVTAGIAQNARTTAHEIKTVSNRISRVKQAAQTTHQFTQTVQSHSQEIAEALSLLLTETREKLSTIGLSDAVEATTAPQDQLPLASGF
jgi:methyl-accepting chemotaxis protein